MTVLTMLFLVFILL